MSMTTEKIRLLVEEDGCKVWRTFEGHAWCGSLDSREQTPMLGHPARDRKRWGNNVWFVFQTVAGKLVVYRKPVTLENGAPGAISLFESFDGMQGAVPDEVIECAARNAGVRQAPQYPEVPLKE